MRGQKTGRSLRSHSPGDDAEPLKGTRRRGEVLEDAILLAAWEELSKAGYAHMTMESVAARAKTNKAVVYRRWPNKGALVVAALKKYLPRPDPEVPDTGNLRTDILVLLKNVTQPLQIIGAETIHGLMVEVINNERISSIFRKLQSRGTGKITMALRTILERARNRGEVSLKTINQRILSLPMDLIRYEIFIRHEPVSDATLNEIVDDIFLPLISAKR